VRAKAAKESKEGVGVEGAGSVRLTWRGPSFRNGTLSSTPPTRTIGAYGWHLPRGTCASFTHRRRLQSGCLAMDVRPAP